MSACGNLATVTQRRPRAPRPRSAALAGPLALALAGFLLAGCGSKPAANPPPGPVDDGGVIGCLGGGASSDGGADDVSAADGSAVDGGGGDAASDDGGVPSCSGAWNVTTEFACHDSHCTDPAAGSAPMTVDFTTCGLAATLDTTLAPSPPAPGQTIESSDEDCSFHLSVRPECSPVARQLYVNVDLSGLVTGHLVAGGKPYIEAYSGLAHLAPSVGVGKEVSPGRYRIGPVVFDEAGRWTVALHFFGACADGPHSPHAHLSLIVGVP
jgi:hypothetical protein